MRKNEKKAERYSADKKTGENMRQELPPRWEVSKGEGKEKARQRSLSYLREGQKSPDKYIPNICHFQGKLGNFKSNKKVEKKRRGWSTGTGLKIPVRGTHQNLGKVQP